VTNYGIKSLANALRDSLYVLLLAGCQNLTGAGILVDLQGKLMISLLSPTPPFFFFFFRLTGCYNGISKTVIKFKQ
jgi:hypothetical protein